MAFAAVSSLRFILMTLDIEKISGGLSLSDELDSLSYKLQYLDFECFRGIDRSEIKELEAKIREAAWQVEDVIELNLISRGLDRKGVEKVFHSFIETSKKLREEYERALQNSRVAEEDIIEENAAAAAAAADAVSQSHDTSTTVGLSDLSEEIIRGLVDDEVKHGVLFSVCGMAGVGKTHLARDIYHHPTVVQHFDLRLWVRIGSIRKDIKNIYVDILAQIGCEPMEALEGKEEAELKGLLHKRLSEYERCLLVLDDVWSSDYMYNFPYLNCKVLLTTRLFKVGSYGNIHFREDIIYPRIYQMPFLSDEDSWNLLSQNVFDGKPFPTQLEKAGRKIAEICEGLPLLILTVADILRDLPFTEDFWNKVAEKKTTTFPDAYNRIYKVLVLSYDYLPQAYKASFLYMGVFPQTQKISATKLIYLWNVEGFFECDHESLEVLVKNNIVIVCNHGSSSYIKSCRLHCAYWYVCVKEAREIRLFNVLNKLSDVSMEKPRRLSVQNNMLFGLKEVYDSMAASTSLTRSLLFTGAYHQYPVQIYLSTMLLMKVLDAQAIRFYEFPNEVLNLLLLRYLTLTHNWEVPSSISKLQCLEILILRRHHNIIKLVQRDSTTCLPKEIWNLNKLAYLHIIGSDQRLPDPDPSHGQACSRRLFILYVNADSCTEGVLKGTPNLRKLVIEFKLQPEGGAETLRCLEHTCFLDELNSLACMVVNPQLSSHVVALPNHLSNLSPYIRKLSLNGLGYPWKYIIAIGLLPFLVVLKLRCFAFRGPKWEIKCGEFKSLEYLFLEDLDVVNWIVEEHLRNLRRIIVRHCYKLKMIPHSYYLNMEMIQVDECNLQLVELVQQIKDNTPGLKVVVNYSWNL